MFYVGRRTFNLLANSVNAVMNLCKQIHESLDIVYALARCTKPRLAARMTSQDIFNQFLPRLTSELNVTSIILLLFVIALWFAYLRLLNRYVGHLETRVDEMARDRLFMPPSSPSPASSIVSKAQASRYQSSGISEASLVEGLAPNAA
jgi:hypothetical protein